MPVRFLVAALLPKAQPLKLATHQINGLLRERYCAPEWAIFFEVQNGTGAGRSRYADALAMNLFPSRGLELHGFEVKVSRSDWKRELSNPHKAEDHFKNCDRWWIVAPKGVVEKDELPPTWGHIIADESGLRQTVVAPRLEPVQWSRAFVAAFLRRASETDSREIDAIVSKRVLDATNRINENFEQRVKDRVRLVEEKLHRVQEVEKAAGISLTDWSATPETGRLIKILQDSRLFSDFDSLKDVSKRLQWALKALDDAQTIIAALKMENAA